ncbi:hypothetical protein [Sorangium sp. So ce233]|uniref:hypothetical protein n=1 Tax=Sorangium sp. So ce233 TaxID=3133290 RepID=UPI003F6330CA
MKSLSGLLALGLLSGTMLASTPARADCISDLFARWSNGRVFDSSFAGNRKDNRYAVYGSAHPTARLEGATRVFKGTYTEYFSNRTELDCPTPGPGVCINSQPFSNDNTDQVELTVYPNGNVRVRNLTWGGETVVAGQCSVSGTMLLNFSGETWVLSFQPAVTVE